MIKNSKKIYHHELFTEIRNDIKRTWEVINRNMNNNSNRSKNIKLKLDNEYIDTCEIPNVFNNNFVNVGLNLHKEISNNANTHFSQFMPSALEINFFLLPATPLEIKNVIIKLKNKKKIL